MWSRCDVVVIYLMCVYLTLFWETQKQTDPGLRPGRRTFFQWSWDLCSGIIPFCFKYRNEYNCKPNKWCNFYSLIVWGGGGGSLTEIKQVWAHLFNDPSYRLSTAAPTHFPSPTWRMQSKVFQQGAVALDFKVLTLSAAASHPAANSPLCVLRLKKPTKPCHLQKPWHNMGLQSAQAPKCSCTMRSCLQIQTWSQTKGNLGWSQHPPGPRTNLC